jgi:reverse gyrase
MFRLRVSSISFDSFLRSLALSYKTIRHSINQATNTLRRLQIFEEGTRCYKTERGYTGTDVRKLMKTKGICGLTSYTSTLASHRTRCYLSSTTTSTSTRAPLTISKFLQLSRHLSELRSELRTFQLECLLCAALAIFIIRANRHYLTFGLSLLSDEVLLRYV